MFKKISELTDAELVALVDNRWNSQSDVFEKIKQRKKANLDIWANEPEWLSRIKGQESRVRQNRIFMGLEHLNNFLLARPSAPMVFGEFSDDQTEDAQATYDDIHDFLVEKNGRAEVKTKIKRAMRQMYASRLFVLKVVWDPEKNDFALRNVDADNYRSNADRSVEMELVREPIATMLGRFDDKVQTEIIKACGTDATKITTDNQEVEYREAWISWGSEDLLVHVFKGKVISKKDNPYWDFNGKSLSSGSKDALEAMRGAKRREAVEKRALEAGEDGNVPEGAETRLYNYFESPRHPYIVRTVFDVDDGIVGRTDFFDQANPLQENVDQRKRQIADNARLMNGVWLVDKKATKLNKSQVSKLRAETEGYILADNATSGIKRDTGAPLPAFVREDLEQSLQAIDEAIGSSDTFRGVQGSQETAEGRAILREQALGRLDELITLVDSVYQELYRWEMQLMKLKYTEEHYVKVIGRDGASRIVSLMRDDFDDTLEIRIKPGQSLPEDKVFRSERAKEALKNKAITPEVYLEETGWENPKKLAKDAYLYSLDPRLVIDLTPEEQQAIAALQQAAQGAEAGGTPAPSPEDARAQQMAQARAILESPEFQQAPPEEQARIMDQLAEQFPELDVPNL